MKDLSSMKFFNPTNDAANQDIENINAQHIACVLLLDRSGSMAGQKIQELNEGMRNFKKSFEEMAEQDRGAIDIAVISFGGDVRLDQDFRPSSAFTPTSYTADGGTPLGQALDMALQKIAERKDLYRQNSTPYYRSWVFCITDGMPTEDCTAAAKRLKDLEASKGVLGYCVGVDGYDLGNMQGIFDPDRCFTLAGTDFAGLFEFVSNSLAAARNSNGSQQLSVTAPATLHQITMTV